MTVNEIIDQICGKNEEDGSSKTMTGCYLYKVNIETMEEKQINSCITNMPIIDIFPHGDKVQIDINFTSEADTDLYKMSQMLDKRLELERDDDTSRYFVVFNFLPMDFGESDAMSIEAFSPIIHCLTAMGPKGQISTLRLLFETDAVSFYEYDNLTTVNEDIDVEYEIYRRTNVEEAYLDKKAKQQEALERIDELRQRQREVRGH